LLRMSPNKVHERSFPIVLTTRQYFEEVGPLSSNIADA